MISSVAVSLLLMVCARKPDQAWQMSEMWDIGLLRLIWVPYEWEMEMSLNSSYHVAMHAKGTKT